MSIHELQDVVKKIMLNDKVDESRELAQHIQSGDEQHARMPDQIGE